MDWEIRIAILSLGIILIAYIFFDYQKKKKRKLENEKLAKQFSQLDEQIDSSGFDSVGVGKPRKSNRSETNNDVVDDFKDNSIKDKRIKKNDIKDSSLDRTDRHELVNDIDSSRTSNLASDAKNISKPTNKTEQSQTRSPKEAKVFSLILKNTNKNYKGKDFMPLLLAQGVRFGEMNIFHRRVTSGGEPGEVLFSVANAIEPGTFDLNTIDSCKTPALAFFMTIPANEDDAKHYQLMVKTVKFLQTELGGEILDENKQVYTEELHQSRLQLIDEYNN